MKTRMRTRMRTKGKSKIKRYYHKCSNCDKEMTRNSREYFCPKCGLTEDLVYTGR